MHILFIQHAEFETPGFIEDWAASKNCKTTYCFPFKVEKLPRGSSFDLIVSMGGPQSASSDLNKYPYLEDEIDFLRSALKAGIRVLGFCLGAQLIGEALGASAERSPHKEIGIHPITLTEEGISDPLLKGLPITFPVAHWHSDMPGLTQEAVVLAKSEGCPRQIIRYNPLAYGFQCHPEMSLECASALIDNCPGDFTPGEFVQTPETILSHDFHAVNYLHITRILDNYIDLQNIQTLLDCILQIPGDKIITLVIGNLPFTIDIQANGQIGYHVGQKQLFLVKLQRALVEGGGMTIRQFLPMKVSRILNNAEKRWLPEKNLYGVVFHNGVWAGLEAKEMQEAHETDATTGAPLPREDGVHYQTFPI